MAEFLTTHATAANIENIILNANEKLVLISPYLQLSIAFFGRLKEEDEKGVKTVIVYGKDQLKPEEKSQLLKLKNLSLFFCQNVHAKCYLNEKSMVITSMNMYEFSEKNNREMGVLITAENDINVYKDALREVESIVKASVKESNAIDRHNQERIPAPTRDSRPNPAPRNDKSDVESILETLSTIIIGEKFDAHCIRCGDRIAFDMEKPYCPSCFKKAKYDIDEDSVPIENYCLFCGKNNESSIDKPLCYSCYKKLNK